MDTRKKDGFVKFDKAEEKKKEQGVTKVERGEVVVPKIPDATLKAVMDLGKEITIWIKPVNGGFKIEKQDKFVKNFEGRILSMDPYLIQFENGVPDKRPHVDDDLQIPKGYERRCDLKILASDQILGISLAASSFKYNLSKYLIFLDGKGLRPEQVITKFFSQQASNAKGTWSTVCFDLVSVISDSPVSPSTSTPSQSAIPAEWA